jgi:dTDP-4-amino-4,6-dideoxygalactose transaminase
MRNVIPLFKVFMSGHASKEVAKVLESGYIGEGPIVKQYESQLVDFLKLSTQSVITCNSATSCEHLIYHLLKTDRTLTIKYDPAALSLFKWKGTDHQSEVISTPLTCTATNWPILHNGYKLVWADIDKTTLNIDLDDVERKINENTRIIQVVHWGGYPVDLDKLQRIISEKEQEYNTKILIVEDCAHALGSYVNGLHVGTDQNINSIATFSTQAIKHLTTIDGGFLISKFEELTNVAKVVRWYGIDRDQPRADFRCELDIPEIGFKFHMNDVNAAVGIANLKYVPNIIYKHKENAKYYYNNLNEVAGLTLLERRKDVDSSYWLFTMLVEDRKSFMKMMDEKGITVSRVHERNDKHSGLDKYNIQKTALDNLEYISDKMICIPVGWWVTEEQREYIVNSIKQGW